MSLSIVTAYRHLNNIDTMPSGHPALSTINISNSEQLSGLEQNSDDGIKWLIYKDSNNGINTVPPFILAGIY